MKTEIKLNRSQQAKVSEILKTYIELSGKNTNHTDFRAVHVYFSKDFTDEMAENLSEYFSIGFDFVELNYHQSLIGNSELELPEWINENDFDIDLWFDTILKHIKGEVQNKYSKAPQLPSNLNTELLKGLFDQKDNAAYMKGKIEVYDKVLGKFLNSKSMDF